jgi:hypothetical protein
MSVVVLGLVPLALLLSGVSIVVVASESVGYRYFTNLRLIEGERSSLFVPQGHTVGALQHLIMSLQQAVLRIPPTRLRATLDTFGYITLLVNWAGTAAALIAAFSSRHLTRREKVSVGAVALVATYGSASGISIAMMPDYYGFETTLTVVALTAALIAWRRGWSVTSWRTAIAFGTLAGLALATKITLVVTGCLPMLVVIVKSRASILARFAAAGLFAATAVVTALLVVAGAYRFQWSMVMASLGPWLSFVRNAGSEPGFWASFLWPFVTGAQPGASYGYGLLLLPTLGGLVLVAFVRLSRGGLWREAALTALLVTTMLLHGWALFRRPAGSTLWELVLFWCAATALIASLMPRDRWRTAVQTVLVGAAVAVSVVSVFLNVPRLLPLRALQVSTTKVWDAHAFLHSYDGDKIVVIPDNRYTTGSVEEALMKGVSDFPTWNITRGQAVLNEVAPRLIFRQELDSLNPDVSVMWIDIPGEASLTTRFPALARREREAEAKCRRWDIEAWPWWPRRIVICPPLVS